MRAAVLGMMVAGLAHGAAAREGLPCVQVIAPAMTPGQVWTGPPLEAGDVPADPRLAAVVAGATMLGRDPAAVAREVRDYAARVPDQAVPLMSASFARLQAMRTETIAGIRTAAERLRQAMETMDVRTATLQRLPPDDPGAAALAAQQEWDARALDADRRLLSALCERPARIEARFGVIARAIAPR